MKTIEVRVYVKMTVCDEFSATLAASRIESAVRMAIEHERPQIGPVDCVELESMNVIPISPPRMPGGAGIALLRKE